MSTPTQNSVFREVVTAADDPFIDSLIHRLRWTESGGTTALTFSFPGANSVWATPYSELNEPDGVQPFGIAESNAARAALALWSRYANLTFTETFETATNVGDIRFAYTSIKLEDSAAHAYAPSNNPAGGDVWIDSGDVNSSFRPGSTGFFVLLHEIGHSLGLKHPFATGPISTAILDPDFDNVSYTVMSYNISPDRPGDQFGISIYPTTPMALDIEAVRFLYGEKPYNAGDTQYIYDEDKDYFETIYDTGGDDSIIWNSEEQYAIIDLTGGAWSSLGNALYIYDRFGNIVDNDIYNVAIFRDSVIENVISGNSDDDIYGNEVGNRLEAGGGHDIVWGDEGADTIIGGSGNDHLYGQSPSGGSDGADSISGGDGSDYLQGNAGGDTLDGGDGSDRINGGGADDSIFGMAGNDTINGNLGADMISGGEGNDSLRGGQGGDSISGDAGNDTVSGDLGADTLSGGEGIDLFTFSGAGSATSQPDRIADFQSGTDRLAIGFRPSAILTGTAQTSPEQAASAAQQLFDGRAGDGELAVIPIGTDSYLFYASGGGGTVDSAIILAGTTTLALSDFG